MRGQRKDLAGDHARGPRGTPRRASSESPGTRCAGRCSADYRLPDAVNDDLRHALFILYCIKYADWLECTRRLADSRAEPEATFRHRGKQAVASRRPDRIKPTSETASAHAAHVASNGS